MVPAELVQLPWRERDGERGRRGIVVRVSEAIPDQRSCSHYWGSVQGSLGGNRDDHVAQGNGSLCLHRLQPRAVATVPHTRPRSSISLPFFFLFSSLLAVAADVRGRDVCEFTRRRVSLGQHVCFGHRSDRGCRGHVAEDRGTHRGGGRVRQMSRGR